MTPETFVALFTPFPDPHLLVTHRGEIVAANPAAERRLGRGQSRLAGSALEEHVVDGPAHVRAFLASCSRSRALVMGALRVPDGAGAAVRLRAEGAVVRPAADGVEALILLRLLTAPGGISQFGLLTRKVEELTREMRTRHRVSEERSALLRQTRADRERWRVLADASAALSGSLDPREVARALTNALARDVADAVVFELRLPERAPEWFVASRRDGPAPAEWRSSPAVWASIPRPAEGATLELAAQGPEGPLGTVMLWRSPGSSRSLDEATRALGEEMVRRAAHAIAQAWLFSELRRTRDELEMQAEELQQLSEELSQSLDELQEANTLLETTLEEARSAELRAREARQEADASNRAKTDFLAMMSHELRTPLNAIAGYAQLLELGVRGALTPEQREDVRRIQVSQRHLLGIINDILNFARLEAGRVMYEIEPVSLRALLERVEPMLGPQLAARRHHLVVSDAAADVRVLADAEKLEQIVLNLLTNSIKYTEPGGRIDIWWDEAAEPVGAGAGAGAEANSHVRLHVRDTGIGIARDRHERIFEPFVQLRHQRHSGAEGTGLGLAISRELARAMGGDIVLESEEQAGATFTVVLKRAAD